MKKKIGNLLLLIGIISIIFACIFIPVNSTATGEYIKTVYAEKPIVNPVKANGEFNYESLNWDIGKKVTIQINENLGKSYIPIWNVGESTGYIKIEKTAHEVTIVKAPNTIMLISETILILTVLAIGITLKLSSIMDRKHK